MGSISQAERDRRIRECASSGKMKALERGPFAGSFPEFCANCDYQIGVHPVQQPDYILKDGTKVITHEKLDDTRGLTIKAKHLEVRKPHQKGVICGVVGGHGGDVYWVQHEGSEEVGAYGFKEFELDQ